MLTKKRNYEYLNVHNLGSVKLLRQGATEILTTGKQRALSLEVTSNFKLYLKIVRTSVKPS